ncbi:hypothetical protein [Streptomyces blattellae]|uniref:hypothetical protein n=1 Tax=Streptomyces blattellae TaxID=2569855 RepID=UPI001E4A116C
MPGAVARRRLSHAGTLVLDCEGPSKFVSDHDPVVALIAEARKRGPLAEPLCQPESRSVRRHRRTDLLWVTA